MTVGWKKHISNNIFMISSFFLPSFLWKFLLLPSTRKNRPRLRSNFQFGGVVTHAQTQPTLRPGSCPVQPQPQLGVQFSERQAHPVHLHCPHLSWLSQFTRRDDLQMLEPHICSFSSMLLLICISILLREKMSIRQCDWLEWANLAQRCFGCCRN